MTSKCGERWRYTEGGGRPAKAAAATLKALAIAATSLPIMNHLAHKTTAGTQNPDRHSFAWLVGKFIQERISNVVFQCD